ENSAVIDNQCGSVDVAINTAGRMYLHAVFRRYRAFHDSADLNRSDLNRSFDAALLHNKQTARIRNNGPGDMGIHAHDLRKSDLASDFNSFSKETAQVRWLFRTGIANATNIRRFVATELHSKPPR